MSIVLLDDWTEQPPYLTGINTRMLPAPAECVYLGGCPMDLASGQPFTRGSGVSDTVTSAGKGIVCNGATSGGLTRSGGSTSAKTEITFIAALILTAYKSYQGVMSSSTAASGFCLADSSGSASSITLAITKFAVAAGPSGITLALNTPYVVVASTSQTTGDYYVRARALDSGAALEAVSTGFTSVSTGGNGIYGAGGAKSVDSSMTGTLFASAMCFKYMPRSMADVILENPWKLFAP